MEDWLIFALAVPGSIVFVIAMFAFGKYVFSPVADAVIRFCWKYHERPWFYFWSGVLFGVVMQEILRHSI